mmetsp:Transcript_14789/g.31935  ORF Transcript_14789/g.31935 Transcript_14789/m.31935 type:complete len:223 (-) Transcript_14789:31-699(-)
MRRKTLGLRIQQQYMFLTPCSDGTPMPTCWAPIIDQKAQVRALQESFFQILQQSVCQCCLVVGAALLDCEPHCPRQRGTLGVADTHRHQSVWNDHLIVQSLLVSFGRIGAHEAHGHGHGGWRAKASMELRFIGCLPSLECCCACWLHGRQEPSPFIVIDAIHRSSCIAESDACHLLVVGRGLSCGGGPLGSLLLRCSDPVTMLQAHGCECVCVCEVVTVQKE